MFAHRTAVHLEQLSLETEVRAITRMDGLRAATRRLFAVADREEIRFVERCVAFARQWHLTTPARVVSRLGNGWLYPVAAAILFLSSFQSAARCIIAAGGSLALAFTVYPPLKRFLARRRPCDYDRSLIDATKSLDRYACPSGHAMTAAAFGVPMIFAAPLAAAPVVIVGCVIVSWSRLALGHHYLSDLVIGTLLGAIIASLVAAFVV
ncbi:MAG TPA: phosphatase PAP2 family protein [Thermoanaerobaculia bacterium]|nr:phosphatase PAP2 family protein [Thermoanaerobaculia bacterium]